MIRARTRADIILCARTGAWDPALSGENLYGEAGEALTVIDREEAWVRADLLINWLFELAETAREFVDLTDKSALAPDSGVCCSGVPHSG